MSLKSLVFFAVILTLPLTQAQAALIKVEFSGSVTLVGGQALSGSGFSVGELATYEVIFDDQVTPWSSGPDPFQGGTFSRYLDSIVSFSGNVGGYSFSGSSGDALIRDNFNAGTFDPNRGVEDQIHLGNYNEAVYEGGFNIFGRTDFVTGPDVNGFPLRSFNVTLTDVTNGLLNNSMLWQENFEAFQSISDFAEASSFRLHFMPGAFGVVDIFANGSFDTMTITNLSVPVSAPSALLLLCFGVGLIRASRKK